jgi:subfamily B ATP-binding cassette protein HlyB/CyaB
MTPGMPRDIPGEAELSLGWLWAALARYGGLYTRIVVVAICVRLLSLVEPFVFQIVIDRILPFGRELSLLTIILVFLGVSLLQFVLDLLGGFLSSRTANLVIRRLSERLFDHIFALPYRVLSAWSASGAVMRIREIDTIKAFLLDRATNGVIDLLFIAVYLALLFSISPALTLIVLAALPFQMAVFFGFGPALRRALQDRFDALNLYQSRVIEAVGGIQTVKAMAAEHLLRRSILDRVDRSLRQELRVADLTVWNAKLIFLIERGLTIGILYVGAGLVLDGALTLGQLVAFYLLADRIAGPIAQSSGLWEAWQNLRLSRRRLNDIVAEPVEDAHGRADLPAGLEPALSVHDLRFSYRDQLVLDGVTFDFPPRALSVVVGPSGVGKSTLGRLLARLETPDGGRVTLGGQALDMYSARSVRRRIAYVPQDPVLFRGTLRENFTLACDDLTEPQIWEALRRADAEDFVRDLPDQLDRWVDERGGTISGGQRQRIALARALALNPDVLVLDEPTSALDSASEARLAASLADMASEMTIIVITHRPLGFNAAATLSLPQERSA